MLSWQEGLESEEQRLPAPVGLRLGCLSPDSPLPLMSQVFRLL